MINIKYESLDDWCAIHGVHYDNNVKVWPDGIKFTASSATNSVPSDEDKERIRHYFDSVVHATSMNRFVKSNYPGLANSTLMNDASLLKIVQNIDF